MKKILSLLFILCLVTTFILSCGCISQKTEPKPTNTTPVVTVQQPLERTIIGKWQNSQSDEIIEFKENHDFILHSSSPFKFFNYNENSGLIIDGMNWTQKEVNQYYVNMWGHYPDITTTGTYHYSKVDPSAKYIPVSYHETITGNFSMSIPLFTDQNFTNLTNTRHTQVWVKISYF